MSPEVPLTPDNFARAEPFLSAKPSPRRLRFWRQGRDLLAIALLALLSYMLISHFLLQSVKVVGVSMSPTLHDSEFYLLNRWIYHVRSPHLADVVVIRDPMDGGFSVKRIVAVAGDSVYLKDGDVYVNGQKLQEPYLSAGTHTYTASAFTEQLFKCSRDQYFLLGDNRNNSLDSRVYGPVPRRNILGMIVR